MVNLETDIKHSQSVELEQSSFLRACNRQKVDFTPIWIMRQAGRYMPEYRDIRSKVGFLELCKNPQLAAEVTVMAVDKLGVDAAIIFADILLLLEPMGAGLEYSKGDGPVIHNPVRSKVDVDKLKQVDVAESLHFVMEAIACARRNLNPAIPLIGFAGAPFTLASYLIEGGSSRHFDNTKMFMYREPESWHALMKILASATSNYLNAQIEAGAQAVQLFDSWIGCLGQDDYKEYVLPHVHDLIKHIKPNVPIIHFGTGTPHLLGLMKQAGGTVMGLDWRVSLGLAWDSLGSNIAVQGNLDPVILLSDRATIKRRAEQILHEAAGRRGHIFNLGHGVLPQTSVDNVKYLIEIVHEFRANS